MDDRFDKVHQRFALPLWAFPVMWAVTFVVLVSVSSAMGAGDPVVRTVEVWRLSSLVSYPILLRYVACMAYLKRAHKHSFLGVVYCVFK